MHPPPRVAPYCDRPSRTASLFERSVRGSARRRTALTSSSLSVFSHDAPQDHSNHRIRRVDIATGETTTLAGSGSYGFFDGVGTSAKFNLPYDVAIAPAAPRPSLRGQ